MATRETCVHYDQCGYVRWRASGVNNQAIPLPENGDCGIDPDRCPRAHSSIPVSIGAFGPQTAEEMETSFPLIPNNHGRPPKRIEGGANR